jgi:hypothetical protein
VGGRGIGNGDGAVGKQETMATVEPGSVIGTMEEEECCCSGGSGDGGDIPVARLPAGEGGGGGADLGLAVAA